MLKKLELFCIIFFFSFSAKSQNIAYVKEILDTLCSEQYYGRGYVNSGDRKAAEFIAKQLESFHIKKYENTYFQPFVVSVNTLPGEVFLAVNNKILIPGVDFTVSSDACSIDTVYKKCDFFNCKSLRKEKKLQEFYITDFTKKCIVIDTGFAKADSYKLKEASLIINITDKKTWWHVAGASKQNKQVLVQVQRKALPKKIKTVKIKTAAEYKDFYTTQNVVGYLDGKMCADSFIVIGAHYDHLGMMGNKTYFPGANDNASGTAMLLDLAAFFSDTLNRLNYPLVFVFFGAEELGLLGSKYFCENPKIPLKKIKFMLNLDMVGTGSEGIKVVNGSIFSNEFGLLQQLNEKSGYLKNVSPRGEAANSDHYYFYKNGVKSFYIYTLGNEYKEYHSIGDISKNLPLTEYNDLFKLIVDFLKAL